MFPSISSMSFSMLAINSSAAFLVSIVLFRSFCFDSNNELFESRLLFRFSA